VTTTRTLVYDNAGNLTSDTSAGGARTYAYNNRNRPSAATVGALAWGYTYNGLEQLAIRTQTAGGAGITHFIHDPFGNVIAETAGGGATGATGTVREYIYLPEAEIAPTMQSRTRVDRPIAVVDGVNGATPATYYVHVDHLNRPSRAGGARFQHDMTNAAKAAVWDAVWLPWGAAHSITGTASLNARFPGQWFQSESGLHYNWHRQYDPSLGRYTQPDPLGFVDGPSVYGYAGARPQSSVDLDGRFVPLIPPAVSATVNLVGAVAILLTAPKTPKPKTEYLRCEVSAKDRCERQLAADDLYCDTFAKGRNWHVCRNQAMERYAHCLAGRPGPLPPLTW
jgi:RHS repeat-associated protein